MFAVLITVLVLDLRPPKQPTFKALLTLWPTWLSYAVSYLFIAIVWTNHHYEPSGSGTPAAVKASRWRLATSARSEPAIMSSNRR
ncbi:MAG: TMEM175 family protein [Methyloceanibacter sp.]